MTEQIKLIPASTPSSSGETVMNRELVIHVSAGIRNGFWLPVVRI